MSKVATAPIIPVVLLFFFLSGMSGLVYELVWTRMLILIFGATTFAISTVLTAFMSGLALGSFLYGRRIDRGGNPLKTYAVMEIGIGAYGLLVPWLFPRLIPVYQLVSEYINPDFYVFSLIRFVLVFGLLLIPTTLMGATLPVLGKFYMREARQVGRRAGLLYAVNTGGAVLGAGLTGFWFLPALGVQGTTLLAAGINLFLGLGVLVLGRLSAGYSVRDRTDAAGSPPPTEPAASTGAPVSQGLMRLILWGFALSGFAAMTYQVAWTRMLSLVLSSNIYAFSLILTTFLLGLALGIYVFSKVADRVGLSVFALGSLQIGIGVAAALTLLLFSVLPFLESGFSRRCFSWVSRPFCSGVSFRSSSNSTMSSGWGSGAPSGMYTP